MPRNDTLTTETQCVCEQPWIGVCSEFLMLNNSEGFPTGMCVHCAHDEACHAK